MFKKKHQIVYSLTVIILIITIFSSWSSLVRRPPLKQDPIPETWSRKLPEQVYKEEAILEWAPKYTQQIIKDEDIHLQTDETLIIENCTYILNGVLLAENNSKVIIRNAELYVEEKNSYSYPGDIVPVGYHVVFEDKSSLEIIDSSIIVLDDVVCLGFFGNSSGLFQNSDLKHASIYGNEDSEIKIQNSNVHNVGLIQNSNTFVQNSTINSLTPSTPFVYDLNQRLGASVHVENSEVRDLMLLFKGATIKLTEPLPRHYDTFSVKDDLSSECEAFWVELKDTSVESLSIYAYDSALVIENQELNSLIVTGSLKMSDTTLSRLIVGEGIFTVSDSVIGYYRGFVFTCFFLLNPFIV